MHAYLVRAPGVQFRLEQRDRIGDGGPYLPAQENSARVLARSLLYTDAALALAGQEFGQRQLDRPLRVAPFALDQDGIALVDSSVAQRRVHTDQRRAFFRDQKYTGGVAVETMDEFEELRLRARCPQLLDQPEGDSAATVHRKP